MEQPEDNVQQIKLNIVGENGWIILN